VRVLDHLPAIRQVRQARKATYLAARSADPGAKCARIASSDDCIVERRGAHQRCFCRIRPRHSVRRLAAQRHDQIDPVPGLSYFMGRARPSTATPFLRLWRRQPKSGRAPPRREAATGVRADSLIVVVAARRPCGIRHDERCRLSCALSRDSHRTAARTSIRVSCREKQRIISSSGSRHRVFLSLLWRRAGGQSKCRDRQRCASGKAWFACPGHGHR
jgi:hypothetical protein